MTEEEYNEVVAKVSSDDPYERLQALFLKGLFPEYDSDAKYKPHEAEEKLKEALVLTGIGQYAE